MSLLTPLPNYNKRNDVGAAIVANGAGTIIYRRFIKSKPVDEPEAVAVAAAGSLPLIDAAEVFKAPATTEQQAAANGKK